MGRESFVKNHLLNGKVTLGVEHLKSSIRTQVETGVLKPVNISRADFLISVQNKVRNSILIAHNASLVFSFRGKNYLLIYNK